MHDHKDPNNSISCYTIYSKQDHRTIVGYAIIRNDYGRHVPAKPSLDKLDGDFYLDTNNEIDFEDWSNE